MTIATDHYAIRVEGLVMSCFEVTGLDIVHDADRLRARIGARRALRRGRRAPAERLHAASEAAASCR